jgi:hypothetical protein
MQYLLSVEELQNLQKQLQDPQKRLDILAYIQNLIDDFEHLYSQDQYKRESDQKDASLLARLKHFLTT